MRIHKYPYVLSKQMFCSYSSEDFSPKDLIFWFFENKNRRLFA